jgi:hypothetical protein
MQIECVKGDCKCGKHCQNQRYVPFHRLTRWSCLASTRWEQVGREAGTELTIGGDGRRFQKKDYAPIDIVKTEKKGFGVRAREDLAESVTPSHETPAATES